ncbi:MAG TPA: serine hydrolase domain-containing protein [Mycobacteriales bacterium]|nr:serine hydrolase domain-containing protein [Mycobacteriales bacterium]
MNVQELISEYEKEAQAYLAEHPESTISFGLSVEGERTVRYLRSADAEQVAMPDASSIYEIGSVSKIFTTSLFAVLEARGVLALEDPIGKHLPSHLNISPEVAAVTLRQLMTHTAGFVNTGKRHQEIQDSEGRGTEPPWGFYTHYLRYKKEHLYSDLETAEFVYPPDEGYLYSVLGMGTLGHILELATGTPYLQLLDENICKPLGLTDIAYDLNPEQLERMVFAYDKLGQPCPNWYHDVMLPQGGLRGTVADLLTFAEANIKASREPDDDSELAAALRRAREVHWKAPDGYKLEGTDHAMPFDCGLAWMAFRTADPQRFNWYHGGTTLFYNAGLGAQPESGVGFAVLNSSRTGVVDAAQLFPMVLSWYFRTVAAQS